MHGFFFNVIRLRGLKGVFFHLCSWCSTKDLSCSAIFVDGENDATSVDSMVNLTIHDVSFKPCQLLLLPV